LFLQAVGVQDDESDEYFNADANISELQEVLRSFQVLSTILPGDDTAL
jgi:hypothetical protein